MNIFIMRNRGIFKKYTEVLATINITEEELIKHRLQRLALVLNKLCEYCFLNTKRDDVIHNFLTNIDSIYFKTEDGLKIDVLGKGNSL